VFDEVCTFLQCFRYSIKETANKIMDVKTRVSQIMIEVLTNVKVECVRMLSKI
jgi:hypothetical protein